VQRYIRLFAILLCILLSGPLLCTSLRAEPLVPLGSGRTSATIEKKVVTNKEPSADTQEIVFSLLHGLTNAATIGFGVRTMDLPNGQSPSASFSLVYDIGAQRYYNGISSFYGKQFHGKKTSSGETFNMNGLSAAHKTLPLGSMIKVTNPENGKSVVVKVNDRGPFVKGRDLDLSYGAAKKIGLDKKGTATVEIESLRFMNFSLLGGARQSQVTEKADTTSHGSAYYGLSADFRLDSAVKAYAWGARDSFTSTLEYEAGVMLDLPGSIKAGATYGKHFDNFEGPGFFLQCKF
jgi:rare lipoprotein A (peptidoglycan hydrolase)